MKAPRFICCFLIFAIVFSCSKKDEEETGNNIDTSGVLGEVGNTWKVEINGNEILAEIISKEGDVLTLELTYGKLMADTIQLGLSNNEVVDYVFSNGDMSKPFTMVKFDAEVGDNYSMNIGDTYFYREVFEKETYHIPALGKDIETIGVYEWIPEEIPSQFFGFTIREILWYWHPVYGLVCVELYSEEGNYYEVVFVQIDL